MRAVVDALPSFVAFYDREGVCQFANDAFQATFGARVGTPLASHRGIDAGVMHLFEMARDGSAAADDRQVTFPTGPRFLELRLTPHDGGVVFVATDISEQQQMADARRLFNEAIAMLESAGDGAAVWDRIAEAAVGRLADWCTIHVRRGDGVSMLAAIAHRAPETAHQARRFLENMRIVAGTPIDDVLFGRPARIVDGVAMPDLFGVTTESGLPLLPYHTAMVVPLTGRDGGVAAMSLAVGDTTRRFSHESLAFAEDLSRRFGLAAANARLYRAEQRARKATERAAERTTRLQAITAQLVGALDAEAIATIIVSQAMAAMRAYAGAFVVPSGDSEHLEVLHTQGFQEDVVNALRSIDLDHDYPVTAAYKSSRPVWCTDLHTSPSPFPRLAALTPRTAAVCAMPLLSHDRPSAVLALVFDEPRQFPAEDQSFLYALARQGAQALERARLLRDVREADRRKDEFLAMLSHELRNPLAPMLTGIQLIREDPTQSERLLATIERQVHHLARLVDDLLDVSRVTRGKIELKRKRVDIGPIVRAAANAASHMMSSRRHTLDTHVDDGLWADADPVRIDQIVANLLNNAAKYTEPGGHVRLSAVRDGAEIVVRVRDNGIGLGPDVLGQVFEPFMQATRALDRAQGGLGLGLTLVKRMAEMHGGGAAAYSDGKTGSEFVVRFPAAEAPTREATSAPHRAVRHNDRALRVLVVDDNIDAADSLAQLLTHWGHKVEVAGDGPSALRIASGLDPELVLLDIGLPGMDGYQVATALRASDPRAAHARVVAVSGYGQASDRERSREAGFDAHLTKPVDIAQLRELVAGVSHETRN